MFENTQGIITLSCVDNIESWYRVSAVKLMTLIFVLLLYLSLYISINRVVLPENIGPMINSKYPLWWLDIIYNI